MPVWTNRRQEYLGINEEPWSTENYYHDFSGLWNGAPLEEHAVWTDRPSLGTWDSNANWEASTEFWDSGLYSPTLWSNPRSFRMRSANPPDGVGKISTDISDFIISGEKYYMVVQGDCRHLDKRFPALMISVGSYTHTTDIMNDTIFEPNSDGYIDVTSDEWTAEENTFIGIGSFGLIDDNYWDVTLVEVRDINGNIVWNDFLNLDNWIIQSDTAIIS